MNDPPSRQGRLLVAGALKLATKPAPSIVIARHLMLPLHISTASGCLLQDVVGRLDQVRRLEFPQKITGADEAHPVVNDRPPPRDVRILEEQKRFGVRIAAQKALQNLERCLLAKRADGPALSSMRRCWSTPTSVGRF